MEIIAFTRLHYGADYLASVIQSALSFVDKYVILYTAYPTFGRYTDVPNPDNRETLYNIAASVAGDKLDWREGVPVEAETAWQLYPQADIALELDADEVIEPQLFRQAIDMFNRGELTSYCYRLPFLHHWRSFGYVCEDSGWPARLYIPRNQKSDAVHLPNPAGYVHHFGYARANVDMRYKWETSAHIGELRREWWAETWNAFPQRLTDVHPVSVNFWDAKPYNRNLLPSFMHAHPYFDREVIE